MSSTICHHCKRIMASALPLCPHCGASQDERSRAQSTRRDRAIWLAMGVGAALGMAAGWAIVRDPLGILPGLIFGMVAGRILVAVRYRS